MQGLSTVNPEIRDELKKVVLENLSPPFFFSLSLSLSSKLSVRTKRQPERRFSTSKSASDMSRIDPRSCASLRGSFRLPQLRKHE